MLSLTVADISRKCVASLQAAKNLFVDRNGFVSLINKPNQLYQLTKTEIKLEDASDITLEFFRFKHKLIN